MFYLYPYRSTRSRQVNKEKAITQRQTKGIPMGRGRPGTPDGNRPGPMPLPAKRLLSDHRSSNTKFPDPPLSIERFMWSVLSTETGCDLHDALISAVHKYHVNRHHPNTLTCSARSIRKIKCSFSVLRYLQRTPNSIPTYGRSTASPDAFQNS